MLSAPEVVERISRDCVPVISDNVHQVETPRNPEIFEETREWDRGAIAWLASGDRARRVPIPYHRMRTPADFLAFLDANPIAPPTPE